MSGSSEKNKRKHEEQKAVNEQWQKLCGLLMQKLGKQSVLITLDEIKNMDHTVICHVTEMDTSLQFNMLAPEMAQAMDNVKGIDPGGRQ